MITVRLRGKRNHSQFVDVFDENGNRIMVTSTTIHHDTNLIPMLTLEIIDFEILDERTGKISDKDGR
jgi:hypothetical protein